MGGKKKKRLREWTAEEEEQFRTKIRTLQSDIQARKEDLVQDSDLLKAKIEEEKAVNEDVVKMREFKTDMNIVESLADIGHQSSRRLQMKQRISTSEVVSAILKDFYQEEDEEEEASVDWLKLAKLSNRFARTAPSVGFLYGAIDVQVTAKSKQARRTKRIDQDDVKLTKAKTMNKVDGDAQQATMTDVRIQDIYKQLPTKDQAPVSFFEFCFEPNSFEEGVERVFDLSFLIKNSQARLDYENGLPIIQQDDPPDEGDEEENLALTHTHSIVTLDMKDWKNLRNAFNMSASD